MITCWEKADLLDLLCVVFSRVFVTFLYGFPGQVWYLIVWIPDLCLPHLESNSIQSDDNFLCLAKEV